MSYYIDKNTKGHPLPAKGKANALIADGAKAQLSQSGFMENLICVMDLGPFDVAKYMYDEQEYASHVHMSGYRSVTWLTHPHAKVLCGFES